MSFPVLHTERLTLRAPGPEDVPGMLAFLASPRSRFYGGPMEAGPAWRRFATFAGDWLLRGYGMFSLTRRDTGAPIGLAGPFHPADFAEPELAWLLNDAAHEGQGFAREGCLAVLRYLFA
ncbi:MAG: GNAT family N-acetyltransferase, partial [Pseudomonadota bacterium]